MPTICTAVDTSVVPYSFAPVPVAFNTIVTDSDSSNRPIFKMNDPCRAAADAADDVNVVDVGYVLTNVDGSTVPLAYCTRGTNVTTWDGAVDSAYRKLYEASDDKLAYFDASAYTNAGDCVNCIDRQQPVVNVCFDARATSLLFTYPASVSTYAYTSYDVYGVRPVCCTTTKRWND